MQLLGEAEHPPPDPTIRNEGAAPCEPSGLDRNDDTFDAQAAKDGHSAGLILMSS